jgi:uncharacterized protein (TIGR02594 family)
MNAEPFWLERARQDIGVKETLGPNDAPWIRSMLAKMGAKWLLGQPWCGGAVGLWFKDCGFEVPKHWYRARAWAAWGQEVHGPAVGVVVVFEREGGGHVGIIVGKDELGRLMVLGGNQGDAVNIRPFPMRRVLAYRWPPDEPITSAAFSLPVLAAAGMASSSNEA